MKNPQEYCPDDSLCFWCGAELPDNPEPDTPAFEGYCSVECQKGTNKNKKLINCEAQLREFLGIDDIARRVYKDTSCGVCYLANENGVTLSGYAEGDQGQCPEYLLMWGKFNGEMFIQAMEEADRDGCERFDELNGGES